MTPTSRDGIILLDKPAGISSHQSLRDLKSLYADRKVGHSGTLDPFATGLLIVLIGKATRLQRFFMELSKEYEVVAQLGACSSTGDPEGTIVETGQVPEIDTKLFTGKVLQKPPNFSAIKVNGERAYKRARRGEVFDLPEREVEIFAFEKCWERAGKAGFRIHCSSGTYIRSLITDLNDAYCCELRRTRIGSFSVTQAHPHKVVPLAEAAQLLFPCYEINQEVARQIILGQKVEVKSLPLVNESGSDQPFALYNHGVLIAVGTTVANFFQVIAVFAQL